MNKYLGRAAKALVISELIVAWQNMAEYSRCDDVERGYLRLTPTVG